MEPIIFLSLGLLAGVLRTAIEYNSWNKKKKHKGIVFAIMFAISTFIYCISDYNWISVSVFILSYWNAFELSTNISHGVEVFYVGYITNFDKLLRWVSPYSFSYLKFALHILTIVVVIILLSI